MLGGRMSKLRITFLMMLLIFNISCSSSVSQVSLLKLPDGFKAELFIDGIENARTMVLGDDGTIFVGTRTAGKVFAIRNKNRYLIADGLNMPNGLAFHKGSLYVAAVDQILRFDNIEINLDTPPSPIVIRDDLPSESHHGWRFIDIGPDGRLYISIGAPCNICKEEGFAQLRSMKLDGTDERVEAKGVRNSVGFTWHPDTKKLWFSDNGRDSLGDDSPPDEINFLEHRGQHFGFPYCHGGIIQDPEFNQQSCNEFTLPIWPLDAHVAPLGITFYTGNMFPEEYRKQLFVAEHGSWDRSEKSGYRIAVARLEGDNVKYETFISGWLQDDTAWGRPAYILILKDGSMLISDDKVGAIYRIYYP